MMAWVDISAIFILWPNFFYASCPNFIVHFYKILTIRDLILPRLNQISQSQTFFFFVAILYICISPKQKLTEKIESPNLHKIKKINYNFSKWNLFFCFVLFFNKLGWEFHYQILNWEFVNYHRSSLSTKLS